MTQDIDEFSLLYILGAQDVCPNKRLNQFGPHVSLLSLELLIKYIVFS